MFNAKAFLEEVHENSAVFRGENFYKFVGRVFGRQHWFLTDDTDEVFVDVADGFVKVPNKFLKYFSEISPENTFTAQYNAELLTTQLERDFDTYTYMNLYELSPIVATKYLIEYYETLLTNKKQRTTIFLQELKGEFESEGRIIFQVDNCNFILSFHRPTWEKRFPDVSIATVNVYDTRSFGAMLLKFALNYIGA